LVTANNPLNPTPAPSAAPTATPTVGPSSKPTTTPTPAACTAPPPDPHTSTITLTGAQQVVTVPCFGDYSSTATVPANGGQGVSVALAASTDKNLGGVADSTYGTPIVYTSLEPNSGITFNDSTAAISTTVTSPKNIGAPHTYAVQVYVPQFGISLQNITGIHPSGHTISFSIAPPGGSFPATEAVVIVYRSS
jgi:hypothetical protein